MSMKLKKIVKNLSADDISQGTDITALKTAVGDNSKGLVKKANDLETAIGDAESGLTKDVADCKTAIGDEDTSGTILYRIKALEDAAKGGSS